MKFESSATLLNTWRVLQIIMFQLINAKVERPYMDEEFHVPQAQRYCLKDFSTYDPKLTTPPGLYILSTALSGLGLPCTIKYLRVANLFLGLILLPNLLGRMQGTLLPRSHPRELVATKLLAMMPLFSFFSLLYYTDMWSLYFVLQVHHALLKRRKLLAVLLALVSLFFRQTNLIWIIAFFGLDTIEDLIRVHQLANPAIHELNFTNSKSILQSFPTVLYQARRSIVLNLLWLTPILALSLSYLIWNNFAIVLGDQSHHIPGLHPIQVLYLCAFLALSSGTSLLASCLRTRTSLPGLWLITLAMCFCAAVMSGEITTHPFILADNRHYTFYLHRKVFMRLSKPLAALLYALCLIMVGHQLRHVSAWAIVLTCAAACATLVPTSLLEFRYFMVPFVLWRLYSRPITKRAAVLEAMIWLAAHLLTVYVFVYKPFYWPQSDLEQRFMW